MEDYEALSTESPTGFALKPADIPGPPAVDPLAKYRWSRILPKPMYGSVYDQGKCVYTGPMTSVSIQNCYIRVTTVNKGEWERSGEPWNWIVLTKDDPGESLRVTYSFHAISVDEKITIKKRKTPAGAKVKAPQ